MIPRRGYPVTPESIGEHILKRRMDLGLTRKETARRLGMDEESVKHWERCGLEPEVRFYPTILSFLGFDPQPEPQTAGEAIRRARRSRGWSMKKLAEMARVDEAGIEIFN